MDKFVKNYEIVGYAENGDEIRLYENGTKRNQKGQLLELPDKLSEHLITSDTAYDMHKLRKQRILESIERSVMDVTKTKLPSDAIGAIVGKRAAIAMSDDTKIGNDAARIVLQAIDAYQNKVEVSTNVQRQEISIDNNTRQLLETIARAKYGTIDVETEETTDDEQV